jgi:thermostable 8-oxoguanine DNA glycosylase
MALPTTAIVRQWLSSDHVVTPTDTNATIALQQRNCVFYALRAEMLQVGRISCILSSEKMIHQDYDRQGSAARTSLVVNLKGLGAKMY